MECWPRNVDISDPTAKQYPGWPRTISQFDNYNPPSWGKLGELTFDVDSPVVQLVDADNAEILYTVRVNGRSFVPGAPHGKTFVIKAGEDAAETIVIKGAQVGSAAQTVKLAK